MAIAAASLAGLSIADTGGADAITSSTDTRSTLTRLEIRTTARAPFQPLCIQGPGPTSSPAGDLLLWCARLLQQGDIGLPVTLTQETPALPLVLRVPANDTHYLPGESNSPGSSSSNRPSGQPDPPRRQRTEAPQPRCPLPTDPTEQPPPPAPARRPPPAHTHPGTVARHETQPSHRQADTHTNAPGKGPARLFRVLP